MSMSLTAATRDLALAALDLYRLALAAEDVAGIESPAASLSAEDGIARPTEHAALCERRSAVVSTANSLTPDVTHFRDRLAAAVSEWEGTPTA